MENPEAGTDSPKSSEQGSESAIDGMSDAELAKMIRREIDIVNTLIKEAGGRNLQLQIEHQTIDTSTHEAKSSLSFLTCKITKVEVLD